jgi:hypothetical protein
MKNHFRMMFALCFLAASPAVAQDLRLPRDPEKLIQRVQAFWQNVAAGQRLQAAEFVLPEKKNLYVSGNPVPVIKASVLGIDLTPNRDMATVRVSLSVLGTNLSTGPVSWTISDPWVWQRGNWYVDLQDASEIFPDGRSIPKEEANKIQEAVEKNFEILRNPVELGKLADGQHFTVEVPIKYSGNLPVAVEPALPNPLIGMPVGPLVTSETKNLVLHVGTDNWEGPFNLAIPLKIRHRDVTIERTLRVTGEVFVPIAFRQDPPDGPLVDGREFSVFVRNNTDQDVRIKLLTVDAKLDVTKQPSVLTAGQETQLSFKRRPGIAPDSLFIQLETPVNGRDSYTFKFRNSLR